MNKWSIDRFEGDTAVLIGEDEALMHLSRAELPSEAGEGSVVAFSDGEWILLPEETQDVRRTLFSLQESLFDE